MLNPWIRVEIVILVAAAVILVAGLLVPLAVERDTTGTVDFGTALSIDDGIEQPGARSLCEEAALNRRTLIYLLSGGIGAVGLIVLAFGWPQRPGTGGGPKHPLNLLA